MAEESPLEGLNRHVVAAQAGREWEEERLEATPRWRFRRRRRRENSVLRRLNWEETLNEAVISSERTMVVGAETREQQALLDLIAEELGDAWFDAEGFEIYAWGETSEGRPVLFIDEVFAFGTLPDGRLTGTMKHASVKMVSFRDGKIVTHAPAMPGDRWAPTNSAGSS